ncbi:MAG: hypothetical protein NPIRA01_03090 [Nitrospirales bacterium]|nr:MAG: hypothetical protein NPIRA01_03090 [Nitrospirales bacterium]
MLQSVCDVFPISSTQTITGIYGTSCPIFKMKRADMPMVRTHSKNSRMSQITDDVRKEGLDL